jgi:hypothetical protein
MFCMLYTVCISFIQVWFILDRPKRKHTKSKSFTLYWCQWLTVHAIALLSFQTVTTAATLHWIHNNLNTMRDECALKDGYTVLHIHVPVFAKHRNMTNVQKLWTYPMECINKFRALTVTTRPCFWERLSSYSCTCRPKSHNPLPPPSPNPRPRPPQSPVTVTNKTHIW